MRQRTSYWNWNTVDTWVPYWNTHPNLIQTWSINRWPKPPHNQPSEPQSRQFWVFFVFVWTVTTLAPQLQQKRIRIVRSTKTVHRLLTDSNNTPKSESQRIKFKTSLQESLPLSPVSSAIKINASFFGLQILRLRLSHAKLNITHAIKTREFSPFKDELVNFFPSGLSNVRGLQIASWH